MTQDGKKFGNSKFIQYPSFLRCKSSQTITTWLFLLCPLLSLGLEHICGKGGLNLHCLGIVIQNFGEIEEDFKGQAIKVGDIVIWYNRRGSKLAL